MFLIIIKTQQLDKNTYCVLKYPIMVSYKPFKYVLFIFLGFLECGNLLLVFKC